MEGWDDLLALVEFWRESVKDTAFDGIVSNDNGIFIESVSDVKKMIVKFCLSNTRMLKENEHDFRSQLWKQLNTYVRQFHFELSLMYRHEIVYSGREAIVESVCSFLDKIYNDSEMFEYGADFRTSNDKSDINKGCTLDKYEHGNDDSAFRVTFIVEDVMKQVREYKQCDLESNESEDDIVVTGDNVNDNVDESVDEIIDVE